MFLALIISTANAYVLTEVRPSTSVDILGSAFKLDDQSNQSSDWMMVYGIGVYASFKFVNFPEHIAFTVTPHAHISLGTNHSGEYMVGRAGLMLSSDMFGSGWGLDTGLDYWKMNGPQRIQEFATMGLGWHGWLEKKKSNCVGMMLNVGNGNITDEQPGNVDDVYVLDFNLRLEHRF